MPRYHVRKDDYELYYLADADKLPIAMFCLINHNIDAANMAFYLRDAAAWFHRVAEGKVPPCVPQTRNRLFSPP